MLPELGNGMLFLFLNYWQQLIFQWEIPNRKVELKCWHMVPSNKRSVDQQQILHNTDFLS